MEIGGAAAPSASAPKAKRMRGVVQMDSRAPVLSFYTEPPQGETSLEEFESCAFDRLRLLKDIETAKARGAKPDEVKEKVKEAYKTFKDAKSDAAAEAGLNDQEKLRRRDVVSHYALRLAFCKTDDQRRWFLQFETALFRYNFETAFSKNRAFVEEYLNSQGVQLNLHRFAEMDMETQKKLRAVSGLMKVDGQGGFFGGAASQYLLVPFQEVLSSVHQRKCLLQNGLAYIPADDLLSFVEPRFRAALMKELVRTSRVVHLVEADPRLVPLLTCLRQNYLAFGDFKGTKKIVQGSLNLDNLHDAAKGAFPPCMRNMYNHLKSTHHHKYEARKQYGLFLKRGGLPMQDSLVYWKSQFVGSHVTPDKFDKEYAYGVRYNYGKEGSGKGFSPFSCMRVIMSEPPNERDGKVHGCPFKSFGEDQLAAMMRQMGIKDGPKLKEILKLKKEEHLQIACSKSFEARYGIHPDDEENTMEVVSHPNDYFDEAMKILEERQRKKMGLAAAPKTAAANNKGQTIAQMNNVDAAAAAPAAGGGAAPMAE